MKPKIIAEVKVKSNLRELCKAHDILLIHYPQNGMGVTGFPDYLAYTKNGHHFLIECKASNKDLTDNQITMKRRLEERDVKYFTYRSTEEDNNLIIDFVKEIQRHYGSNSITPITIPTRK